MSTPPVPSERSVSTLPQARQSILSWLKGAPAAQSSPGSHSRAPAPGQLCVELRKTIAIFCVSAEMETIVVSIANPEGQEEERSERQQTEAQGAQELSTAPTCGSSTCPTTRASWPSASMTRLPFPGAAHRSSWRASGWPG